MAITATLGRSTKDSLAFVLVHDGLAGDTLTIANATLLAAANQGGPIATLLATAVANNAAARRIVGGYDPADPVDSLTEKQLYIEVRVTPHTGAAQDWGVIANEDDGGNRIRLVINQIGAAEALLELTVRHSYNR